VPIARYFIVVGSALIVLLLIAGWSLPETPSGFSGRPEIIERAAIRIRSEHKWPEKVVLDTNQPTFSPRPIEVMQNHQSVDTFVDEVTDQTVPDVVAWQNPDVQPIAARRAPARAERRNRTFSSSHVVRTRKRHGRPALGAGQECCRLEWESRPLLSVDASRRRVARRDLWMGWHLPEAN
jgi:hypothetical protein